MFGNVENGEFWLAMLTGVVVLWIHARSQFNQLSLEQSGDYRRLISKLQSSDLRTSAEYRRAFVIYAAILTVLYVVLCIYVAVPDLQQVVREVAGRDFVDLVAVGASNLPKTVDTPVAGVAFDEAGGLLGSIDTKPGLNPSVPLAISLAVVGLAPNVPWLSRVEEFIRGTAHRLAGIPTRLVNGSLALSDETFVGRDDRGGLLLGSEDWVQIARYREALDGDFAANVVETVALRAWIMHGGELAPRGTVPSKYAGIERDVADRIEKLTRDLDVAIAQATAKKGGGPTNWTALRREARETWEDMCLILGLYGSQRPYDAWLRRLARTSPIPERRAVAARLQAALDTAALTQNADSAGTLVFFRISIVVLVVSFLAGFFIGDDRSEGRNVQGQVSLALTYMVTAMLTYVFPLCFALHYQQQMTNTNQWHDWRQQTKHSQWVPQYFFVGSVSFAIAFLCNVSFNLASVLMRVGFEPIRARFAEVVGFAVRQSGFEAMKGAALALLLVMMVDVWRAQKLSRLRWRLVLAQTLVLVALAIVARFYASWIAGTREVSTIIDVLWRAAVPAMAIGLVSALYVAYTLEEEFPPDG
jgi:hypothetical protein